MPEHYNLRTVDLERLESEEGKTPYYDTMVSQGTDALRSQPASDENASPKYGEYGWGGLPWEGGFWGGLPWKQTAREHQRRNAQAELGQMKELRQWLELAGKQRQEDEQRKQKALQDSRNSLDHNISLASDKKFWNALPLSGKRQLVNSLRQNFSTVYGGKPELLGENDPVMDYTPDLTKDVGVIHATKDLSDEQKSHLAWEKAREYAARGDVAPGVASLFKPEEETLAPKTSKDERLRQRLVNMSDSQRIAYFQRTGESDPLTGAPPSREDAEQENLLFKIEAGLYEEADMGNLGRSSAEDILSNNAPLPNGLTEEDVQFNMDKHGKSRQEVIDAFLGR
jgi:hypothetical protein